MTTTSENEMEMAQAVCRAEDQPAAGYLEAVDTIAMTNLTSGDG